MNQGKTTFYTTVLEYFNLVPNEGQEGLFLALEKFARQKEEKQLFILKGYAGTGKTSALGAFVKGLNHYKVRTKLVAPTGRAAKVFSHKSDQEAMTIHKMIYRRKSKIDAGSPISLQANLFKNTVFIVDEASMIGDYTMQKDGSVSARNLLEDLFEFVYSGDGCKLILMGDDGQLPPVGSDTSPALSEEYLTHNYLQLNITSYKLSEVVRQAQDSEILRNATRLRNTEWVDYPKFNIRPKSDLIRITGAELQDELESSFSNVGQEETIVITRSNKNANLYNQQIRGRILWYEEELCSGDSLMVVKNNYFWMGDDNRMGFIANGEIVRVKRILKREEIYGFEFAKVSVEVVVVVVLMVVVVAQWW